MSIFFLSPKWHWCPSSPYNVLYLNLFDRMLQLPFIITFLNTINYWWEYDDSFKCYYAQDNKDVKSRIWFNQNREMWTQIWQNSQLPNYRNIALLTFLNYTECFKDQKHSQVAVAEAEAGQLGLEREFQDSQGYKEEPCPKKQINRLKTTNIIIYYSKLSLIILRK